LLKVIRDEKSCSEVLVRVDELAALDPDPTSPEGEELTILAILIEDYERRTYIIENPTPLEAIKFRMDQAGLCQRDLIPFIGSKSKTSEVLSGRRPLSLPMIRALSENLDIPAEVLIQEEEHLGEQPLDITKFPQKEIERRGWFSRVSAENLGSTIVSILNSFGSGELLLAARMSAHVRSGRMMDNYSLLAWAAWTVFKAKSNPPAGTFDSAVIDRAFLTSITKLSPSDSGPLEARDYLSKAGISLVVAKHLPRTYLDGALILGTFPVVALTLRHDRIDSFWFTLLHELAHLLQVCSSGESCSYFDDLDVDSNEDVEREADRIARETLIPDSAWASSPASKLRSPEAAQHLARQLGINPAIVAGRIRHDSGDYRKLSRMVGQGQVRKLFDTIVSR
jgi:HTH-type transcriptional regulator/antitoxin HigA